MKMDVHHTTGMDLPIGLLAGLFDKSAVTSGLMPQSGAGKDLLSRGPLWWQFDLSWYQPVDEKKVTLVNGGTKMRREAMRIVAIIGLGSVLLTGCYTHRQVEVTPTGQVVVTEPPPPVRHEVITTSPGAQYVWAAGYWTHTDNRWVWIPGHWQIRPAGVSTWVPGHWDKNISGWIWTPGHWE